MTERPSITESAIVAIALRANVKGEMDNFISFAAQLGTAVIPDPVTPLPTEPAVYRARWSGSPSGVTVVELLNSPREWVDATDSNCVSAADLAEMSDFTRLWTAEERDKHVLTMFGDREWFDDIMLSDMALAMREDREANR